MYDFFEVIAKKENRVVFRYLRNDVLCHVTYAQYLSDISSCLSELENRIGSVSDRHVGMLSQNCYEYLVLMAAVIMGGGVAVPLNIRDTKDSIESVISDADIDTLIANDDYLGLIEDTQVISLKELLSVKHDDRRSFSLCDQQDDKLAMIIYTSGTTGGSKGTLVTLGNLFGRKKAALPMKYRKKAKADESVNTYLTFPLYHMAGIMCWICWCETGCTTFINEDIGNMLYEFKKIKVDFTLATPMILKLLAMRIKKGHIEEIGGLKAVGSTSAPIERETIGYFVRNGIEFSQIYGMTEATGDISNNYEVDDYHIASVGQLSEGIDAKLIDGELCLKGSCITPGYYKRPEDTRQLFVDGYMHTGDLAHIDEDGYIFLTGRKKNLIILSGGENVSPEELEAALYKNEYVKECKVIEKNDRIVAEVFADTEHEKDITNYISELNKKMPVYKRIFGVEFRDTGFEKTSLGKIKR